MFLFCFYFPSWYQFIFVWFYFLKFYFTYFWPNYDNYSIIYSYIRDHLKIRKREFSRVSSNGLKLGNKLPKVKRCIISMLAFEKVDFRHLSRCEQFDDYSFDWLSWQLTLNSFSFLTADFSNIWRFTVHHIETVKNISSIFMHETNRTEKKNEINIPQYRAVKFR